MKILITGAHFTPAIATITELRKFDNVSVVYAGRKTTLEGDSSPSPESQVLLSMGVKFIPLTTGRLQRKFSVHTIPSLLKIPLGFIQALYIILTQKPDVILSFGGYVAVPVVFMGWLWSIPIIIHEQALKFGLANKISSYFADKIAVSFKESSKGEKIILTGNPIRQEIAKIEKSHKLKGIPTVLIMGGSQGAHAINVALEESLDKLLQIASIIHIAGDNKFKDFENLRKKQNDSYKVIKWAGREYYNILQKADLVVCRSGINTLMELAVLGKPALTIPIPFGEEQSKNAKYFAKAGLVKELPQSKLSGKTLFESIKSHIKDLPELKEKAKLAKRTIEPDGAKRLALETILLANDTDK